MSARAPAPKDAAELLARAESLASRTLGEIADVLGVELASDAVRTKGKIGELVERALGASAGSAATPDFPHLGVELKTIPVAPSGTPRESTYVTYFDVTEADQAEWRTSRVRAKLAHVLWVPIHDAASPRERTLGAPRLWTPNADQEAVLRADFDELVGLAAIDIERVTAHRGRWLQLRPKAKDGSVRTIVVDEEGERIATTPRGFYLRAAFTGAILRDPNATP